MSFTTSAAFFIDYPKIFVVRVFYIAIGGFCCNGLSACSFGLNACCYFLADVSCVPFGHDIDKGGKFQCILVFTVYTGVDDNKVSVTGPAQHRELLSGVRIVVFHVDSAVIVT